MQSVLAQHPHKAALSLPHGDLHRIRALLADHQHAPEGRLVPLCTPPLSPHQLSPYSSLNPLHSLATGVVHEWFATPSPAPSGTPSGMLEALSSPASRLWHPPLAILLHLAREALALHLSTHPAAMVACIGTRVWPCLHASPIHPDRCLLIDPPSREDRIWAADLCLQSPAIAAVLLDGSRLTMADSRRLQLAAGTGRALALVARPWWERHELSAAHTRWAISPLFPPDPASVWSGDDMPPEDESPLWSVELLRCKGVQPSHRENARHLVVRRDHETGSFRLVSPLAGGPYPPTRCSLSSPPPPPFSPSVPLLPTLQ